ncbi:hypothetical protein DENIS_4050 [Desulfonema ishimotonii]|uniref:Tubulin like n=1 Tax=Desulfonema ishimotonii TaxID=45657 RepID=A0A401G1H1_9BACT|nr:tubulin-like doman-containing protein [Desulfonema ishimotonii]GBC63061.1 hypothetical protein DENIS_4050 [Desulfonema ishimotonii]
MKRIQPAVVIGLGGTGVKTITYLKKMLLEHSPDSIEKNFVRFLAIDIDELKGEIPSASLFGENIRLDPQRNEFFRITDQTRGATAKNIPAVSNWFPEEGYRYLPLTEGAKQAKPIGRLGFFLSHENIARELYRLTSKLVTPETKREFPGIRAGELNVYIVSSVCGGTGAGMFVDIAYELRYLQQQAQLPEQSRIKALLAMGDVYDAISKRVLANTYASLREINWIQKENASYHPVYPDGARNLIQNRAFDAVYLFGDNNSSDIQFASPDDFAHLCAEFIFLDSGSDIQEQGDPLSAMMQSTRNNAEVYTMNSDADGIPRCYSSLGLCKVRFPAERVSELCAARMSHNIIEHHIIGRLEQSEILEARQKCQDFLANEGLNCTDDNTELPDRLVEKKLDSGERMPFDTWITKNLHTAYNNDLNKLKDLEIGRIHHIQKTLNDEAKQLQTDMPNIVLDELSTFTRVLQQEIRRMFQENLGVSFVAKFLEEMLENARASRDFGQQEMKNRLGHEKRLADQMNKDIREMANLLEGGLLDFLRRSAQRAQLKDTYGSVRKHFINQTDILKMRAAVSFYDGVYDSRQKLMEGGEGAISILSNMSNNISLIQAFVANLSKTFIDSYEDNKAIQASPFEILIYDNENFSTLNEIFDAVYNDSMRTKLFKDILEKIGGSIWNVREYMDDTVKQDEFRDMFLYTCKTLFMDHVNKKTVAQRIREARQSLLNPIDYAPKLQSAFEISDYFCRLNDAAARFADLRNSEQAVTCVVAYQDENDQAWNEIERTLREAIGRGIPFTHTSDIHNILIYREFCGFPAYTLRRVDAYHNSYTDEARRENTPPLQMLTREELNDINIPTRPVLSKFEVMTVEALALGVIICEDDKYYMVTPDELKRRTLAKEAQARGEDASIEDRTAGKDRELGSRFTDVIGRMNEKLREEQRLSSSEVLWMDQVQEQIAQRKKMLKRDMLCDLYEAVYFGGFQVASSENVDLETQIRPSIVFILLRDFALKEDHIHRPKKTHAELIYSIYVEAEGISQNEN